MSCPLGVLRTELLSLGPPEEQHMLSTTEPSLRHLLPHVRLALSFLQLLGCALRALVLFLGRDASQGSLSWAAASRPCHLLPFDTCPGSAPVPPLPSTSESSVGCSAVCPCARPGSAQTFPVSLPAPCLIPHSLLLGIPLSPVLLCVPAPPSAALRSLPPHFSLATLLRSVSSCHRH